VLAALLEDASPLNAQHPTPNTPSPLSENEAKIFRSSEERDACRSALEEARKRLEVVIFQIVRFVKDGKPAPMPKAGRNIYELRDLITELGQAVAASATKKNSRGSSRRSPVLLSHAKPRHLDGLRHRSRTSRATTIRSSTSSTPTLGYVVLLRKAQEAKVGGLEDWRIGEKSEILQSFNPSVLRSSPRDLPHQRKSSTSHSKFGGRLKTMASTGSRLTRSNSPAPTTLLRRMPGDPARATRTKPSPLALCESARIALKSALDLLGVSAPERMDREEAPVASVSD